MAVRGVYRRGAGRPGGEGGDVDAPSGDRNGGGDVPDLVVVGCASRDRTADDPRGWRLGGGATYASLAAAQLGIRVGCVLGVDGEGLRAAELDLLRYAGVDLVTVRLERAPVFDNVMDGETRRQVWYADAEPISPAALPDGWRACTGWLFASIAAEIPVAWASVPPPGARVGLGWQGLLREFGADGTVRRVAPRGGPVVAAAGLVCASVDDLPPDTALASVRELLAPGATLVATAASNGGLVFRDGSVTRYRAVPARLVDATGAGDVFLGALMAGWLSGDVAAGARSLRLAAAAASCSVEGLGLLGVPSRAAVEDRLRRR